MTTSRPLLDRGAESEALQELLADAAAGRGGVVVIEGPAGIGKTALVRHQAAAAADQGLRVVRATGSELETGFPFGVARQLLEPSLETGSDLERAELLAGPAVLAAQLLGPGLTVLGSECGSAGGRARPVPADHQPGPPRPLLVWSTTPTGPT